MEGTRCMSRTALAQAWEVKGAWAQAWGREEVWVGWGWT
jgi:hypothetical protein